MNKKLTLIGGRAGKKVSKKTMRWLEKTLNHAPETMDVTIVSSQISIALENGTLITLLVDATQ
ncbi:hypothetical protein LCGC14_0319860 [marine sediment metagenome]|uniref:Uncharacterized protein n=1 Tax=marine sediment metagenome TaxID=412755 RepID=A0A0F9WRJ7_9ZZZZ